MVLEEVLCSRMDRAVGVLGGSLAPVLVDAILQLDNG